MELKFEDIEFTDSNILGMNFSGNYDSLVIDVENGFLVNERKWLGRTKIIIKNWESLTVENYVSEKPFLDGENVKVDWKKEFYELEMIQKTVVEKDFLSLSGFIRKRNGWLTYTFKNCDYSIIPEC